MLQCSKLDREINCFVGSVEDITAQVCHSNRICLCGLVHSTQSSSCCQILTVYIKYLLTQTLSYLLQVRHAPPDAMFNLRASVKDRFSELMAEVSNADLQRHSKVIAFKDSIRKYAMQGGTFTLLKKWSF